MASPGPSNLNETLLPNSLVLIIKAANQKYVDFHVENSELNWTIKELKIHLNKNYPKNPEVESIRLIYSGKMLHDHWTLRECLRQNSETKAHIIHIVHSSINQNSNLINSSNLNSENEIDLDNEYTPNSSFNVSSESSSSSSSSTSSSPISTPLLSSPLSTANFDASNLNNVLNNSSNLPFNQFNPFSNRSTLTPKQQYNQMHSNLVKYYQSIGFDVQTNPWYSSYVQHMALYNHMYSNYLESLNSTLGGFETSQLNQMSDINTNFQRDQTETNQHEAAPAPAAPQPQNQQQRAQNRAAAGADGEERDDDWLSILHNAVSFLVLFSIVYYYSSLERFLVIFTIALVLIIYHNGWLSLQRRQINQNNRNQNNNRTPAQQQENLEQVNNSDQQNQTNQPSLFRFVFTFVFTFFTSLIPERPRVQAN